MTDPASKFKRMLLHTKFKYHNKDGVLLTIYQNSQIPISTREFEFQTSYMFEQLFNPLRHQ